MTERKFLLTFPPAVANKPVTQRLWKDFDITVNILRAEIDDSGGRLTLALDGTADAVSKAIEYLSGQKVRVEELRNYVGRDDAKCNDCGMCVSICPVRAYELRRTDYHVVFHSDRCVACGICLDACPSGALSRHRTSMV